MNIQNRLIIMRQCRQFSLYSTIFLQNFSFVPTTRTKFPNFDWIFRCIHSSHQPLFSPLPITPKNFLRWKELVKKIHEKNSEYFSRSVALPLRPLQASACHLHDNGGPPRGISSDNRQLTLLYTVTYSDHHYHPSLGKILYVIQRSWQTGGSNFRSHVLKSNIADKVELNRVWGRTP